MNTTLNKIKEHSPCSDGWKKLLANLGKSKADDETLSLMSILKSNGIEDAIWALKCFDYLDYCLFLADIAESVLHIYEKKNESKAPREAIQAIRDYKAGKISRVELTDAANAANTAAYTVNTDAAYSAYSSAYAAAYAAYASANAAADATYDVAYAAYDTAYTNAAAADANAAREEKWTEIEQLFIKRFGRGVNKE